MKSQELRKLTPEPDKPLIIVESSYGQSHPVSAPTWIHLYSINIYTYI